MAVIQDPFHGLIDGILQGHAIAQQLHQQSLQDEQFQRAKERDAREAQLQDFETRMKLVQSGARPVTGGSIQDQIEGRIPDASGDLSADTDPNHVATFLRPPDKSRLVKFKDSTGSQQDYELPTQEEQLQRSLQQQLQTKRFAALGDQDTKNLVRQTFGKPLPTDVAMILNRAPGEMLLPDEITALTKEANDIRKSNREKVGQGETVLDLTPTPATTNNPFSAIQDQRNQNVQNFANGAKAAGQSQADPRILFSNPPKEEKPTGDFEKVFLPAYAKKLNKDVKDLLPDETMKAFSEFKKQDQDQEKRGEQLAMDRARLAIDRSRLAVEQRNAGLDANGQPIQHTDAQGNLINISPLARQIAAYKMPPASARSYQTNRGLMDQVLAANPNFDIGAYQERFDTMKDLRPGGKLGQQSLAVNTLIRHSDDLIDMVKELGNSSFKPANALKQKWTEIFGGSAPTNFDQLKQFVAGETVKLVRGGGGSAEDERNASANINKAGSPEQLAGALDTNFAVAGGRVDALNQAVRKTIGDKQFTSLDEGSTAILKKRGYDTETLKKVATVRYTSNGQTYAIPAAEEAAFLKDHPNAVKAAQ